MDIEINIVVEGGVVIDAYVVGDDENVNFSYTVEDRDILDEDEPC